MIGRSNFIACTTSVVVAIQLGLCTGCASTNISPERKLVRERISESNKAAAKAVAPIFDIQGRSPSAQGRAIEERLSQR